jgi:hypothetical protein
MYEIVARVLIKAHHNFYTLIYQLLNAKAHFELATNELKNVSNLVPFYRLSMMNYDLFYCNFKLRYHWLRRAQCTEIRIMVERGTC